MLIGNNECWHGIDPHFSAMGVALLDHCPVSIAGQKPSDDIAFKTNHFGNVAQGLAVADVYTHAKIGLKQGIYHDILLFLQPGPMNETMGIDRIGRALHSGKINRQAERLRGLLNLMNRL